MSATGGLLPKVMAAYNAGPVPVGRWNYEVHDNGDPLLFIESIPYYETRAYVTIVMRNYWMYQKQAGEETSSLSSQSEAQTSELQSLMRLSYAVFCLQKK